MSDASLAIESVRLSKRYGTLHAVDDLELRVPTGVVAGFVGPNGAGKTTTIRMLLGLVRPSSGTAQVLGEPIDSPDRYLGRVGALVEGPAFTPSLSGRRNLRGLSLLGAHDPSRVQETLELVGLADRTDEPVRSYSLGMKQRLGIAAALLGHPTCWCSTNRRTVWTLPAYVRSGSSSGTSRIQVSRSSCRVTSCPRSSRSATGW